MGHFYIFSHKTRLFKSEGSCENGNKLVVDELTEKEAEYFASCLLILEENIVPIFEVAPLTHRLLWDCLAHFKVRISAVAGFYAMLGPTPILMIGSANGQYEKANMSKEYPFFKLNLATSNHMPEWYCINSENANTPIKDAELLKQR